MRTLAKLTLALSFIGATAIGPSGPVQAQGFYFDAPGAHVGVGYPYLAFQSAPSIHITTGGLLQLFRRIAPFTSTTRGDRLLAPGRKL